MSRISFTGARTGKRARTGGTGLIGSFEWEMGDRKRLIFPVINGSVVMLAKPYHPVVNRGAIVLPKSNGQGTYAIDKVRCTHAYAQTSFEEGYKMAKTEEPCVFCQVALYEERRKWQSLRSQYTKEEFQALTKEEKKAVFNELNAEDTVGASFYSEVDSEGNTNYLTHYDIYILALDLSVDARGEVITETVNGVVQPKFQPVLMPASKARLEKFKNAVENSLMSGMLSRETLRPYVDNQGTDMEEEVLIGWVDFLVTFPQKAHKMESGKDMGVMPMAQGASVVTQAFIDAFEAKSALYEHEAEKTFDRLYVNLQAHTAEDAKSMFAAGASYVDELASMYRITESFTNEEGKVVESDTAKEQAVFKRAIENYEKAHPVEEVAEATQPVAEPTPKVAEPTPQVVETTQTVAETTPVTEPSTETVTPQTPQLDDSVFDI